VILAAIAGGILYLLIRRRRGRGESTNPVPDTTT
jgi:hypothetical protein